MGWHDRAPFACSGNGFMGTGKTEVTINDIARFARVSKSTVSRVLNNVDTVSEAARARVRSAIRTLNYRPSTTARNLARRRSNTIALIVQDIRNPYYSFASWFVEKQFRAHGFHFVAFNADNQTLLFATSDFTVAELHRGEGFFASLQARGVSREKALVFSQTPIASVIVPSLSTMRQPQQGMIKAGMNVLTSLFEGSRAFSIQRRFPSRAGSAGVHRGSATRPSEELTS
jgi:DNA-binding LacI/PurR family transcriptional regulator